MATQEEILGHIKEAADKYDLPYDLLKNQAQQESNFDPDAESGAGAKGVMQLMPETAKSLGVKNIFDPKENIDAGARYLKQQYDKYGDYGHALAAYNAGPGNVDKYGGVPPFKETKNYVSKILGNTFGIPSAEAAEGGSFNPSKYSQSDLERYAKEAGLNLKPKEEAIPTKKPADLGQQYTPEQLEQFAKESGINLKPATQAQSPSQYKSLYAKPPESPRDNPLLGFATGMARQLPIPEKLAGGLIRADVVDPVMNLVNLIKTGEAKPYNPIESFKRGAAITPKALQEVAKLNPVSSALGGATAAIPEYALGGEALGLGGEGTSLMQNINKGAALNAAIGQGARGTTIDPHATAIDALLGVGGELAGAGTNKILKSIPGMREKLFNSALGVSPKDIMAGRNLGKDIVGIGGVSGTTKSLYKKAIGGLQSNEEALQNILSNVKSPINRDIVGNELNELVGKFKTQPLSDVDVKTTSDLINEWGDKFGPIKSASEANELKRQIYKMLGDRPYFAENLPAKKDALKAMARGLKKSVEDVAPETQGLNKNLATYGKMRDLLETKLARGAAGKESLMDAIKNPVLGAAGYTMGGAPGVPIALSARSLAKSTLGKTGTAQALKYLEGLMRSAISKGIDPRYLGPAISTALR